MELNLLKDIRSILEKPENWCKGSNFKKDGATCKTYKEANQFSLYGAFLKANTEGSYGYPSNDTYKLFGLGEWASDWNNKPYRMHSDVLELIDKAIKKHQ